MLQVDVVDVEIFTKGARNVPVRAVVVGLHREIGPGGEWMRPFCHHIPTAHADVARARLGDAAIVPIAMVAETVAVGRIPVQTKSTLSHVPAIRSGLAIRKPPGVTTAGRAVRSTVALNAETATRAGRSRSAQRRTSTTRNP